MAWDEPEDREVARGRVTAPPRDRLVPLGRAAVGALVALLPVLRLALPTRADDRLERTAEDRREECCARRLTDGREELREARAGLREAGRLDFVRPIDRLDLLRLGDPAQVSAAGAAKATIAAAASQNRRLNAVLIKHLPAAPK